MKAAIAGPRGSWLLVVVLAACGEGDGIRESQSSRLVPSRMKPEAAAQSSGPACSTPLPATLQAEAARLEGVDTASETQGFEGSGYVRGFGDVGDQITFDVCVPESAYYTLDFRYAKGTRGVATRTVLVDGREFPAHPAFSPEWSGDDWTRGGRRSLHLEAGQHQLALAYRSADIGELDLDAMTIEMGPMPSEISVRSLLMNDWDDLVVGWHAANLYPADDNGFGPHMTALHSRFDWPTNQLDQAQAYLRDDTAGFAYDDPNLLSSRAYFAASDEEGYGELRAEYGPYDGRALPVELVRRQIVPPEEDGVLVVYELENDTGEARDLALLEWADLHNKTMGPSEDPADTGSSSAGEGSLKASWHEPANAWIIDMTQTNGTALVVGAFEAVDRHVAGRPVTGGPDRTADTVQAFFDDPASLESSDQFESRDVAVGLARNLQLEPGASAQVAFFYGVSDSVQAARALAEKLHGSSVSSTARRASDAWKGWLASGKASAIEPPVAAWRDALETAMITIRQAQQPEFGSFVAATNPAYYYSVWPRDAAVTAIGLDAAGYLGAAEMYWRWMAQAQADGSNPDYPPGTWWTNYEYWKAQSGIQFVSPEWDSLGLFLSGVYHHHRALEAVDPEGASQFLADVWSAVRNAADFIQDGANDASNHGFGPQDYSIWEENLAYHTFTQTTYVAGLRAAERLAASRGEDGAGWGAAASSIEDAIFRPTSASPCPGLWEPELHYFIRSVLPDCTPNRVVDAASDLLWVFGVLSPDDERARQHREAILANLTPSDWGHGVARYEGDTFYYSAGFNPGGKYEAMAAMPTWPQMTSYMAMLEHWLGMDELADLRLSWIVSTEPHGFVPQGEAVDWSKQRPLISTAAEPVTGAWFSLALLTRLGELDLRIPAGGAASSDGSDGKR